MNTSIVASGIKQDIGTRVVLWDEPGGLNSYPAKRFNAHNDDLEKLRKRIQGFVIHHSASWTAKTTFSGAAARGFSVNFIIDDDLPESGVATIYQCLDIKDAGWSQGSWNDLGSGVEIALQPARWIDPNYYSEANQKKYGVTPHSPMVDTVHGRKFDCFGPTEAQYKALMFLINGYCKIFPDVPREFPREADYSFSKNVLTKPTEYRGLVNHYHIDTQKIDCLALDMARVEKDVFYPF